MLCWRLNFNSFCAPLPMTFISHRAYDVKKGVKICLEWHAKIALVILLLDFVLTDKRGRESGLLSG